MKLAALFIALTTFGCGGEDDPGAVQQPASDPAFTAVCTAPARTLCNQACLDCVKTNGCYSLVGAAQHGTGACIDACSGCPE